MKLRFLIWLLSILGILGLTACGSTWTCVDEYGKSTSICGGKDDTGFLEDTGDPNTGETGLETGETGQETGGTVETGYPETGNQETGLPSDQDGDGYTTSSGDCDDADSEIYPGATETCDGQDQDCDGATDEDATDQSTWYADQDGDGYGNAALPEYACSQPTGYVSDSTDCNDATDSISPDAEEVCDSVDNDCDGGVDEEVEETFYADVDGDGYGDPDNSQDACSAPAGFVENADDCADNDSADYPGAPEDCDSRDNDCDGTVDNNPVDGATWYLDWDGDGFGDEGTPVTACTQPASYAASAGDCDTLDPDINPGVEEVCDSVDNNCDGEVDEDSAEDAGTWYLDSDGDGYGDPDVSETQCVADSDYVSDNTDCNDADSDISPDSVETCNGDDDDCDGTTDEDATDATTWYEDVDGDGYGNVDTFDDCDMPSGYAEVGGDCDDADASVNPDSLETCNGVDDDCNGTVDNNPVDPEVWYEDADGDGYGDVSSYDWSCDQPAGYVSSAGDYNDGDSSVYLSPCQESLVVWGLSSYLYTPMYEDLEITVTESTATDYILILWTDASAPTGYWISCGEVTSLSATMLAPDLSGYNANAWYNGYEGYSYPEYLTALSREDGVAFSLVGASYSSTVYFEETP